jgi:hypothetical protein
MAVTMTPRGKAMLGAGLTLDYGDYAATDGTATTLTMAGGLVVAAMFFDGQQGLCANAGTTSTVTLSAKATSAAGITTYTLTPGGTAVANGSYMIIHGGA